MIAQPIFSMVEPTIIRNDRSAIWNNLPILSIIPAAGITAITVISTLPSFCRKSKLIPFFFLGSSVGSAAGSSVIISTVVSGISPSVITVSLPAVTLPSTAYIGSSSASSQIRTGVIIGTFLLFRNSRSTSAIRSPALTISPTCTWLVKPSPFRATLSRPIWIRISRSSSDVKPYACNVSATLATSPFTGA